MEAHSCLPSHQEAGDGRQSGSAMSGIGINFCKDRHKDGQRAQTAKKRGRWSVWEDLGVDQGVWRRGGTHWLPVVKPPREGLSLESLDPGSRPLQSPKQRGGAFEQVSHSAWEGSSSKHRDAAAPHSHQAQRPPHLTRQPIFTTHDTPQGQDGPSQQPEHGRLVHGHLGVHRRPDRWVH